MEEDVSVLDENILGPAVDLWGLGMGLGYLVGSFGGVVVLVELGESR